MNKPILIEVDRAVMIEQLSAMSNEELCKALLDRGLTDERLCELLKIEPPELPEDEDDDPLEELKAEAEVLYDAIAEGRTRDALEILYNLVPESLVYPTTAMRLVELRRSAT